MNNRQAYDKARNVVEPEFAEILKNKKQGFNNVRQGTMLEDFQHIDVFGTKNGVEWKFDVKDLTPANAAMSRRNYTMSDALVQDVARDIDRKGGKYDNHFTACRIYRSDGTAAGTYAVFKTAELVGQKKVKEHLKRNDPSKKFWLFNIDECMRDLDKTSWWIYGK